MQQNQDASILSDPKSSKVKEALETCKEVSEFSSFLTSNLSITDVCKIILPYFNPDPACLACRVTARKVFPWHFSDTPQYGYLKNTSYEHQNPLSIFKRFSKFRSVIITIFLFCTAL